ncbi:MAG: hypothetical protein ABL903_17645 [Methylococcales bacterium]
MLKKSTSNLLLICLMLVSFHVCADDLNDGIGIDEPIDDKIQLNPNIDFLKQNAISKAGGKENLENDCQGTGNLIIGPGADLGNATIVNLSNNKKSTQVCIEK